MNRTKLTVPKIVVLFWIQFVLVSPSLNDFFFLPPTKTTDYVNNVSDPFKFRRKAVRKAKKNN